MRIVLPCCIGLCCALGSANDEPRPSGVASAAAASRPGSPAAPAATEPPPAREAPVPAPAPSSVPGLNPEPGELTSTRSTLPCPANTIWGQTGLGPDEPAWGGYLSGTAGTAEYRLYEFIPAHLTFRDLHWWGFAVIDGLFDCAPTGLDFEVVVYSNALPIPSGTCCEARSDPGCDDSGCADSVCSYDPFCCTVAWDSICVAEARNDPFCRCTSGTCCLPQEVAGCVDAECQDSVCSYDPFCCNTTWDALCVSEAAADPNCECGVQDSVQCCYAHGSAGCPDTACQDAVCAYDPFCCEVEWDNLCADEAAAEPACSCAPYGSGDCCDSHATPNCDDHGCRDAVCTYDPWCCDVSWDSICVTEARLDQNCRCAFPGPAAAVVTEAPLIESTGLIYGGAYELHEFRIPRLPEFGYLDSSWIMVRTLANVDNCAFYWLTGASGDGAALSRTQLEGGVPTYFDLSTDLGLCLTWHCPGDANCDGQVDFADINALVAALSGGPICNPGSCDVNGNGVVGFDDINPFVAVLASGGLPIACP